MLVILCQIIVGIIHTLSLPHNTAPILNNIGGGSINLVLLVMAEVLLVLVPPISPPRDFILVQTGMMRDSIHI